MNNPLIIDAHLHIGKVNNFFSSGYSTEELVNSMDRLGISKGCVSSMYAIGPDASKGNQEIVEAVRKYPDRLVGMLCVNPSYKEEVEEQINIHMASGCFQQFKLHPFLHGTDSHHENYEPVYVYAQEHRASILIHTWGERDVSVFSEVASKFREAIFIVGHAGGDIKGIQRAVMEAKKHDNIVLDITSTWNYDGAIEFMVNQVGADRVIFGSDAVFNSQSAALGRVLYSRLTDNEKEKVLGLNMKRILSLREGAISLKGEH